MAVAKITMGVAPVFTRPRLLVGNRTVDPPPVEPGGLFLINADEIQIINTDEIDMTTAGNT